MNFLFAQICGAFALIFVSISYFLKDRYKFLIVQMCVNFFYAAAFFIAGAYVGAAIMLISCFRCLYLFVCEKKSFRFTNQFLLVFVALYIVSTIVFWLSWVDMLSLFACLFFTVGFAIKKIEIGRSFFIIACILYLVYNVLCTTYISAVANFFEAIVIFCSIIKFHLSAKIEKSEENLIQK